MGAIQIKNVPEDVHQEVRDRAAERGQSIGEYALELLRRDLRRPRLDDWLTDGPARRLVGEEIDLVALVRDDRDGRS